MRALVYLVLISLFGGLTSASAQQSATRSGFTVVTLVSGNIAGLIAVETLRNETEGGVQQAVVGPSPLLTSASILVPVGPRTESTTALAVANPSLGSGAVNLILTEKTGRVVLNTVFRLGPRGQLSKYLNEFFSSEPTGPSTPLLLTVVSEIPIAIMPFNFHGADFSSMPLTSLSSPTPVPIQPLMPAPTTPIPPGSTAATPPSLGGPFSMVFAQTAIGGAWSSEIAIGNTSAGLQTVRIDFFGADGSISSLDEVVIQPRGVFSFSN